MPMYITHRRDLARDGNQPLLLYGYGGFDVSLTPQYRPQVQAWLEMGGVYAEANLRGGGEYGEAWHKAGTLANKQHVFDDFIAAAEYLIREHYTRTARLGDPRPQQRRTADRRGADAAPGSVRRGAAGRRRARHAALPDRERQRAAVVVRLRARRESRAVSRRCTPTRPYQNVKKGTCYPPTLITTADHDDRVVPWHSYKFAAALQAAQTCPNPILIRIETRAGHGAGKPVWMQIDDFADQWAFLAKWLGMTQPGPTPGPAQPAQAPGAAAQRSVSRPGSER